MLQARVSGQSAHRIGSRRFHGVQDELRAIEARTLLDIEAQPPGHRERERQSLRTNPLQIASERLTGGGGGLRRTRNRAWAKHVHSAGCSSHTT
jgi:hypothetical protein